MSRIDPKFTCECSGKYLYSNKSKHLKTEKHNRWLEVQQLLLTLNNKGIQIPQSSTSFSSLLTYLNTLPNI